MLRITTSAQGAAGMPAGARSTDPGLTNFQRAQLRAQEQGSAGGQMQAYGSLAPNSNTNQYRAALGAPAVTAQTANGMAAGGQAQATSNPLAGSNAMQPAVQPGGTALGQPQSRALSTGGQPPGSALGNMGQPNPAAVSGMAPGAQEGPLSAGGMQSANPAGSMFQGGVPQTGLIGSEQALQGGLAAGMSAIGQGYNQGRQDLTQAAAGANAELNPYAEAGVSANDYQAALSGALGTAAQQQAMDSFSNSPGQQYLLNESERAINRNAAATGGLGGGNVQRALQENAIGLAAQDFDNSFNRLGTVSDRGLNSSTNIAGNRMALGNSLAGLGANAANTAANMAYGTGNAVSAGRTRAGELIAGNIENSSSNLANIVQGTGQNVSNAIGSGTTNLANLLAGSGRDNLQAQNQLATLLANIATGSASDVGNLPSLGQTQETSGALEDVMTATGWIF